MGRKAKTFRRKRLLTFLKMLHVKRDALQSQLESDHFQESRQMIEGELKAIEMVIKEFNAFFHVDPGELKDDLTEEETNEEEAKDEEDN